jgi:hypothetical protein
MILITNFAYNVQNQICNKEGLLSFLYSGLASVTQVLDTRSAMNTVFQGGSLLCCHYICSSCLYNHFSLLLHCRD